MKKAERTKKLPEILKRQFPKHWLSGKEGCGPWKKGNKCGEPYNYSSFLLGCTFQAAVPRVEPNPLPELRRQSWKSREAQGDWSSQMQILEGREHCRERERQGSTGSNR